MAANGIQPSHACACLNVRITPQPALGGALPSNGNSDCDPVYVGEHGLSVTHTQVTLRTRSRVLQRQNGEALQPFQYTSLTCLICGTLAYRVQQEVSPDVESGEGPILPTDDWVEQEMLKSATGWIEVYKSCLTKEAIDQAAKSSTYSNIFSIVLPVRLSPPCSPVTPSSPRSTPSASNLTPQLFNSYLPPLPLLFSPPPFTPSHPAFAYLSSLATAESERLRRLAEDYVAEVAQKKLAELRATETELKKDVELLWHKFREGMAKMNQDRSGLPHPSRRRQSSGKWTGPSTGSVATPVSGISFSVRINNFEPTGNLPLRPAAVTSTTSTKGSTSALSASLATSSFHYPGPKTDSAATSSRYSDGDSRSRSSSRSAELSLGQSSDTKLVSPSTASSRTVAMGIDHASGSIRDAYRRNMDESKDTATSFRYVLDMEAQMEAMRAHADDDVLDSSTSALADDLDGAVVPVRSPRLSRSAMKNTQVDGVSPLQNGDPSASRSGDAAEKDTGVKGKRKVTFDVKPDVAIIDGETMDAEVTRAQDEEPIFDMESESMDAAECEEKSLEAPAALDSNSLSSLPDSPVGRPRAASGSSLPTPFANLRPTSLPTFSNVRRTVSLDSTDRPRSETVRDAVLSAKAEGKRRANKDHGGMPSEELDPREVEILRLVAANTPSHRHAWTRDSKSWQLFVSRQDASLKARDVDAIVEEEEGESGVEYRGPRLGYPIDNNSDSTVDDERDDQWSIYNQLPIASSLPIPIVHRNSFGAQSYQQKTSLTDRPGILVPQYHNKVSSAAMRRAAYAERDRGRSIDPGALDFAPDYDEDEEDDNPNADTSVGGRARQRALRILQARNEVPAAGMWRSLA